MSISLYANSLVMKGHRFASCCYALALLRQHVLQVGNMGQRRGGLFLPDQRCLGGAMVLNSTYNHMLHSTLPKEAAGTTAAEPPSAAQLSQHRARKLAQADTTMLNHQLNLHSLARRMRSMQNKPGSLSSASCSQQQPSHQPAGRPRSASGAAAAAPLGWKACREVAGLCSWLPESPTAAAHANASQGRRPATAPAGTSSRHSSGSGEGCSSKQHQPDWQLLKQRAARDLQPAVRPVQLPQSRFYAPGPSLLPSVQARLFKAAIMQDILERSMYRAAPIRALCHQYVAASPLEHRELLRAVTAEVLQELHVQP